MCRRLLKRLRARIDARVAAVVVEQFHERWSDLMKWLLPCVAVLGGCSSGIGQVVPVQRVGYHWYGIPSYGGYPLYNYGYFFGPYNYGYGRPVAAQPTVIYNYNNVYVPPAPVPTTSTLTVELPRRATVDVDGEEHTGTTLVLTRSGSHTFHLKCGSWKRTVEVAAGQKTKLLVVSLE